MDFPQPFLKLQYPADRGIRQPTTGIRIKGVLETDRLARKYPRDACVMALNATGEVNPFKWDPPDKIHGVGTASRRRLIVPERMTLKARQRRAQRRDPDASPASTTTTTTVKPGGPPPAVPRWKLTVGSTTPSATTYPNVQWVHGLRRFSARAIFHCGYFRPESGDDRTINAQDGALRAQPATHAHRRRTKCARGPAPKPGDYKYGSALIQFFDDAMPSGSSRLVDERRHRRPVSETGAEAHLHAALRALLSRKEGSRR
jgi:hypothetical protein